MKKFYLLLSGILLFSFVKAQNVITVAPGTLVSVSSGTSFSMGGLSLTPSSGFTFDGINLSRSSGVTHYTVNPYASRVYQFSGNTNAFSGTIRFYYQDAELNGLSESSLRVNIHNGTSWTAVNSAVNDAVNNYVETIGISGQVLNELALADLGSPLPLKWGAVNAYRESHNIQVSWTTLQEENISYFTVDRSTDGTNWSSISVQIPAHNSSATQLYNWTDNDYNPLRLFYRIRQTSNDGKFSYSRIVAVEPDGDSRMVVYPNPVTNMFYITNINPALVNQVRLYNSAGRLLRNWTIVQPYYDIHALPRGIYQLQVLFRYGHSAHSIITKQ